MNLLNIMTKNPITIRSDKSLRSALRLMSEHNIHHLPVLSRSHHLIGVLSDRDCRHALSSPFIEHKRWQNEDLTGQLKVNSIMTTAPIVVESDTSSIKVVNLMLTHQIGCIPIMRSETLIGIVTRSDILLSFIKIQEHYINIGLLQ